MAPKILHGIIRTDFTQQELSSKLLDFHYRMMESCLANVYLE